MATATPRFTGTKSLHKIDGNWVDSLEWDVIGFTDENDAVAATGYDVGSPHPLNSDLICTSIRLVENKLTLGVVAATFEITSLQANPLNPLNRQPIAWHLMPTHKMPDRSEVEVTRNGTTYTQKTAKIGRKSVAPKPEPVPIPEDVELSFRPSWPATRLRRLEFANLRY